MIPSVNYSRRFFIKSSAALGLGLSLGIQLTACNKAKNTASTEFSPGAWLRIAADNQITVILSKCEMGQGVMTALSMLIAEELNANWNDITIELADADDIYGSMLTAGSSSIRELWLPLRTAGAAAKEMLLVAAAQQWGVTVDECHAESGQIIHSASNKSAHFGELTHYASQLDVPASPVLKAVSDFRLIGKSIPRIDAISKVTGAAKYGIDTEIEGLKYAAIRQAPTFGASVISVNDTASARMHSHTIVNLGNAVAVVADTYWQAQKTVDALDIEWSESETSKISDSTIKADYQQLIKSPGTLEYEHGSTIDMTVDQSLSAEYEVSFQAHATMEPMNCTAHVHDNGCDIWVPTQHPQGAQDAVKEQLQTGLKKYISKVMDKLGAEESVNVHTTLIGGGFGRRLEQDFVVQAVKISSQTGAPVKLIWSRSEDIQHDFYRPYTYHRLQADLSEADNILEWRHRIVGPTHGRSTGGATHLPYDIEHVYIDYHKKKHGVPIGSWRSIGSSHNAFVIESFIDEIAHARGIDPLIFRQSLMKQHPRSLAVMNKAAEAAGWDKNKSSLGIAVHPGFGSYVAQVADIYIENGKIRVRKIICAVDCGLVINPDIVRSQIEGGVVFGLTAALKNAINISNGQVKQSNFHDYPILSIEEMPEIEVHLLNNAESPGGVGEIGVPPVAAAVANAVFAATGRRLRQLPLKLS